MPRKIQCLGPLSLLAVLLTAQPAHANPSFVVTSTSWTSPTGLKAAVDYANANPGTHITFAIPTSDAGYVTDPQHGGYFRIIAQDTLSVIASGTFIDGDSQRLSPAGDTNPLGPEIFLDGNNTNWQKIGVSLGGGSNQALNGMTISRFWTGVNLGASADPMVDGCYIGTDPFALSGLGNIASGIWVHSTNRAKIGTVSPNVIADNQDGVYISFSPQPTVIGNFIGVSPTGTVIGNLRNGVRVEDQSDHSVITGNHVAGSGASGILLYGPYAGVWGNLTGNEIRASGCLPIHLQPAANTGCVLNINDPGDPDTGPNDLQNYPILTGFTQGRSSTAINGTLNSEPNTPFLIEFYSNSGPNNLGFVEPRVFLGSTTVNSDSNGNATFSYTPPHTFAGQWVTASATQKGTAGATGLMATSEFFKGIKAP